MTKVVDGGWWEGICGDRVGWFPGLYVEEISTGAYRYPITRQIRLHCRVSVSEPHTSELNCRFFIYVYIYVYIYLSYVFRKF